MFSRSRKTCLPLAIVFSIYACSAITTKAFAQSMPKRLPSLEERTNQPKRPLSEVLQRIKRRSDEILQVNAQVQDSSTAGGAQDGDQMGYNIEIESEPPSRARLFKLRSGEDFIRSLAKEQLGQAGFLLPYSADIFDVADSETLGPLWYQNRLPRMVPPKPKELRGEMRVKDLKGIFPVGSQPEVGVLDQPVGTRDMNAFAQIWLGDPQNRFGFVLRALNPDTPDREEKDQIDANEFYYVTVSATEVRVGKREKGSDTRIASRNISPMTDFKLTARIFGNVLTVFRNDVEILKVVDDSITEGEYVGVYGVSAVNRPVTFDDFIALRYGGPYVTRTFEPSVSVFEGANVHYQPLYFEQAPLERYGHHLGNLVQPWIAHGLFFGDLLALPYSIGKAAPWDCHSGEGFARPGDVVLPFRLIFPVWDKRAAGLQTAVTVLTFSLVP